jgi:fibronectin type III domain protein
MHRTVPGVSAVAATPGGPNITRWVPGPGSATIYWTAPSGYGSATEYLVQWGSEGGPEGNETVPGSNVSAILPGLVSFTHYLANVTALYGTAAGPPSASVAIYVFGWTRVSGTVTPSTASVWVDSVPVPVESGAFTDNTSLTPHLVSASAANYRSIELVVLPTWNGTSWANVTLALLPGTLEGYVTPVTSIVTWNGASEGVLANGFFSFTVPPSTPGELGVSYPGLIAWARNVSVAANTTLWENVTLAEPNATLTLHLDPIAAALFVDGASVVTDANGNATVSLGAGTHRLEATDRLYYPYFANVTLTAGEVDRLSLVLTAEANTTNPNGTAAAKGPLSDPVVLGILIGIGALAVAIVVLGRRGREAEPAPARGPDEYGVEATDAVDVVDLPPPEPPAG